MNQIRLQNLTGRISIVGTIVKLAPNSTTAYVVADTPDPEAIGTVAQSVPNKYWGLVNLINTITDSDDHSHAWIDITGKPSTFPPSAHTHTYSEIGNPSSRIVTNTTTELTTDNIIVCNKASAMSVYLLDASGSNRIRTISNIGVGLVTVYGTGDPSDPSALELIDGELSQDLRQFDSMTIIDYSNGRWKII